VTLGVVTRDRPTAWTPAMAAAAAKNIAKRSVSCAHANPRLNKGDYRLWMGRLNEGACCSSYDDERSHYRAHEDDGRFGEFAHRALRRLFADLSVSTARIHLPASP
jgi:hypothetical protein